MLGDNPKFELEGMIHLIKACREIVPPNETYRLGPWEHPLKPNPAALTWLRNAVTYYAQEKESFRPFLDTVVHDYSSPNTTRETFQSDFYHDLEALIKAELQELTDRK